MYKLIIFFLLIKFSFSLKAQLPTIYCSGGKSIVDWFKEKKKVKLNQDDNPFLYGSGCTESPTKAIVSSTLVSQGAIDYKGENLFDWDPQTPWIEGELDYGIGERFQVDLPFGGSNVGIFNGYQKSYDTWKNNSRVKKLKVYGDGRPLCYLVLKDLMGFQTFDIPNDNDYGIYTFEILEVYPGQKWKDVAISEICNMGCCFNVNTSVLSNGGQILSDDLKKGRFITTLDIDSETISESKVSNVFEMKHTKMIRVITQNHSIEITPYHPLYIKDHGFISLLSLKKSRKLDSYDNLTSNLWVLVWNEKERSLNYEKIDKIELLFGEFFTYSILKIEKANTYIVNGFISTTY